MIIDKTKFGNCLMRYRGCSDRNLMALMEGKQYFSSPKSFNDPYDVLVYANRDKINEYIKTMIDTYMEDYVHDKIDEARRDPLGHAPSAIALWYGDKKEVFFKVFLNQVSDCVTEIKEMVREKQKVISFSENIDNILMWSHYAEYHKGFCLIFDKDELQKANDYDFDGKQIRKKHRLVKVQYTDKRIDLSLEMAEYVKTHKMNPFNRDMEPAFNLSQETLRNILVQKAKVWEYEAEWRLIPRYIDLEKGSNMMYTRIDPIAVVCGAECDPQNREKIIDICRKKKIDVYDMGLNSSNPDYSLVLSKCK